MENWLISDWKLVVSYLLQELNNKDERYQKIKTELKEANETVGYFFDELNISWVSKLKCN